MPVLPALHGVEDRPRDAKSRVRDEQVLVRSVALLDDRDTECRRPPRSRERHLVRPDVDRIVLAHALDQTALHATHLCKPGQPASGAGFRVLREVAVNRPAERLPPLDDLGHGSPRVLPVGDGLKAHVCDVTLRGAHEGEPIPVSYTHLTLPTIY